MGNDSELSLDKSDMKDLFNRVKELEISDKVQDEKIDTIIGITKETLGQLKEHTNTFKIHDEKEMKKYDDNDRHIIELTTSVKSVISGIDNINKKIDKQEIVIQDNKREAEFIIEKNKKDADTKLAEHKQKSDENFQDIIAKQNKFIGGLTVVVIFIGLLGGIFSYVSNVQEKADEKERLLQEQIRKLEVYVNRNDAKIRQAEKK
jgi:organic radical activating enzyme